MIPQYLICIYFINNFRHVFVSLLAYPQPCLVSFLNRGCCLLLICILKIQILCWLQTMQPSSPIWRYINAGIPFAEQRSLFWNDQVHPFLVLLALWFILLKFCFRVFPIPRSYNVGLHFLLLTLSFYLYPIYIFSFFLILTWRTCLLIFRDGRKEGRREEGEREKEWERKREEGEGEGEGERNSSCLPYAPWPGMDLTPSFGLIRWYSNSATGQGSYLHLNPSRTHLCM